MKELSQDYVMDAIKNTLTYIIGAMVLQEEVHRWYKCITLDGDYMEKVAF